MTCHFNNQDAIFICLSDTFKYLQANIHILISFLILGRIVINVTNLIYIKTVLGVVGGRRE